MDRPTIQLYVDPDIDKGTLDRHIQADLDRGAVVCIHFHKKESECEDSCETRASEVEHRNVFDQTQ